MELQPCDCPGGQLRLLPAMNFFQSIEQMFPIFFLQALQKLRFNIIYKCKIPMKSQSLFDC